jgi:hypothetical protein
MDKKVYRLKKDVVIPAGTMMSDINGITRRVVNDGFEKVFGLTNDTHGYFTYFIDEDDPEVFEWFEEVDLAKEKMDAYISDFVDTLSSDGEWYKADNKETYIKAYRNLQKLKLDRSEIEDILISLYDAARSEYGE